ncbi:MAG TPA: DUF1573 domain-containing protein [Gemmataceae bacterium]|nr:DUF1573 domain-containing protein [Gemmataceae bacterium]
MFRWSLALFVGLWLAASASAGSWADAMFEDLAKDFGSVPRGPAVTHPFRLTNSTGQTVHISGVRVSCGCTSAQVLRDTLAPGESTAIQATMDTHRFVGIKNVTIYVTFDQPQWEEVRLWVQANGRDDITVSPEAFALGRAKRGSSPSASVTIAFLDGQSQILDVQRESNYVQTTLKEVRREAGNVAYQLTATVRPDAPVGKWFSDVWLKTNNPAMPRVRVPLNVEIESGLNVSPPAVTLGDVKPGGEAARKVIVRGTNPFRITKVQGTDDQLSVRDNTPESKTVHVLTVTFKPKAAGDLTRKLKVFTDLKEDGEIEFEAKALVSK